MKKLSKAEEKFNNMLETMAMAVCALKDGFGPAHNSDKAFAPIPGKIEKNAYYVIIVEKVGNGKYKPVDWYGWSPESNFLSGFGGWHNYSYDEFIEENPWVKYW